MTLHEDDRLIHQSNFVVSDSEMATTFSPDLVMEYFIDKALKEVVHLANGNGDWKTFELTVGRHGYFNGFAIRASLIDKSAEL